jgi:uncharacterized protein YdhG (YjbR/CyaY superfamily)
MKNSPSQAKTIEEYIKNFPKDVQEILQEIRKLVKEEAPNAVETISYQMPAFKLNNKTLVYFAAWKEHIGFYPTPSGTEKFQQELSPYMFAKGSIQFSLEKEIPYALIRKIVQFRVSESNKI